MQQDTNQDERPGYNRLLKRRRFLWETRHRVSDPRVREELAMLARINNKLHCYDWVQERGHAIVPHDVHPSLADALRANRLDRFVLKPVGGHSSKGVYLLQRRPQGGYSCAMTGRDYASDTELIAHHARILAKPSSHVSAEVILEAYVEDSQGYDVPLDYKVYAFACGTPIVMQRYAPVHLNKTGWGFEFYDENGQRLGPIRLGVSSGERWKMMPPSHLADMFQMARALVSDAQVSFVRIDLYSTPAGPVFGEFTPVPNNAEEGYTPAYDQILGDLWLRSLDVLGLHYHR